MGFAQSFLAGHQIKRSEEDRKFRALQAIMGRKPVTTGRAVAAYSGPTKKAEDQPRVWEEQAEEEHRAQMRAEQAQINEEMLEQARLQNKALRSQDPTARDITAQQAIEAGEAWGRVGEIERGMPVKEAQQLAGKEALDAGLREKARKKHISGYANKDPKLLAEGWKGMFPGAQFEAKFDVDPQGQIWITYPGGLEPEPYDQGAFRQFAMFAGNTGLEQKITTPGGGEITAVVGGAKPGKTAAAMSVKDYLSYLQKERKGQIDMYDFARKYAEGKAPMVDELGQPIEGAEEKHEAAWDEAVALFQKQPSKAYDAGVAKPKKSVSISQGKELIKQAVDEYNDFKNQDKVVDPKEMFNKLIATYGPRVAFGFLEAIKKDVFPEKIPTGTGRFDVAATGIYPTGVKPGEGFRPGVGQPKPYAPQTVDLPNTGDTMLIDPISNDITITESDSGAPTPITQAHIDDLIMQAKKAPPEQRGFWAAIFDLIKKRAQAEQRGIKNWVPGAAGIPGIAGTKG